MFLRNIFQTFRQIRPSHRGLYSLSGMIFCFVVFDGLLSFAAPLLIVNAGISESTMGIIIGASSAFGAIFDFLICLVIKKPTYRRLFFVMFILGLIYPLVLWHSESILIFIFAMSIWGLYYDLYNLGTLDFVGKEIPEGEHASSFGVIRAFHSLGYIIAPLLAGLVIGVFFDLAIFILAWTFLVAGLVFFRKLLWSVKKNNKKNNQSKISNKNSAKIYVDRKRRWFRTGKILLPFLVATCMLNIFDAAFWTIGPLLSEDSDGLISLGSLFIISYQIPPLLVGWFVGRITLRKGKKSTAFLALLGGSAIFSVFPLLGDKFLFGASFLASFMIAIAWPAISAIYADYISESPKREKEIETFQDYFTNIGYVVGPILAGYFSQNFGHIIAFSYLGIIGVATSSILIVFSFKKKKVLFQ